VAVESPNRQREGELESELALQKTRQDFQARSDKPEEPEKESTAEEEETVPTPPAMPPSVPLVAAFRQSSSAFSNPLSRCHTC